MRAKTKLQAAILWAQNHPEATQNEAVRHGLTKSTFYQAKKVLRGGLVVRKKADETVDTHPLVALIEQMEQKLGLVEFHYKDGILDIYQRRTVMIHGSQK